MPVLQSRLKETAIFPCLWINGRSAITLVLVTLGARQPQVFLIGRTTERQRHDMIDFH